VKQKTNQDLLYNSDIKIDDSQYQEMLGIYPIDKAIEEIRRYLEENEDGIFMDEYHMSLVVANISSGMLFANLNVMEKSGLLELVWDSKKEDFAYTVKDEFRKSLDEINKSKELKEKRKKKK
jgi:hypothetical protein